MSHRHLFEAFFAGLEGVCKNRSLYSVDDWILREREFMLSQVNVERAGLGKKKMTLSDIERAETMAVGHCDYTRKFAWYCVELVLDRE